LKVLLISKYCSKCKELLNTSLFRQFVSEVLREGFVVVGDEAYIFGFDYTDKNIYFDRVGYETPSVMDTSVFDIIGIGEFSVGDFVALLKKLPKRVRSGGGSGEGEEEGGTRKRGRRSSFVKRKQLKKELKRASEGCLGDVCEEV